MIKKCKLCESVLEPFGYKEDFHKKEIIIWKCPDCSYQIPQEEKQMTKPIKEKAFTFKNLDPRIWEKCRKFKKIVKGDYKLSSQHCMAIILEDALDSFFDNPDSKRFIK